MRVLGACSAWPVPIRRRDSGPLGALALLFTPSAMVIAQALLAAPIITALTHRACDRGALARIRRRTACRWRNPDPARRAMPARNPQVILNSRRVPSEVGTITKFFIG